MLPVSRQYAENQRVSGTRFRLQRLRVGMLYLNLASPDVGASRHSRLPSDKGIIIHPSNTALSKSHLRVNSTKSKPRAGVRGHQVSDITRDRRPNHVLPAEPLLLPLLRLRRGTKKGANGCSSINSVLLYRGELLITAAYRFLLSRQARTRPPLGRQHFTLQRTS